MKETRGDRLHIGFYGKRNVGKSTLFNSFLGQDYSIVSVVAGTTTDVNQKSMELKPIGAVILMDCAGIDDKGTLGEQRIEKTLKTLDRVDVALYLYCQKLDDTDKTFIAHFEEKKIPYILIENNKDTPFDSEKILSELLKIIPKKNERKLLPMVNAGDVVVLVTPIDAGAPQGRLILPQVQALRSLLDEHSISVVCQVGELVQTLSVLKEPPKIVITDSQVFKQVSEIVPESVSLTSFSVVFANFKGNLSVFVQGAKKLESLAEGDKILILESCTHHATEDDIGKVKIPNLVRKFAGCELQFEHYSGFDMPKNLAEYALIIHCGACMTNRAELLRRIDVANATNVAISNYGIVIAKCLGILDRAIEPFET